MGDHSKSEKKLGSISISASIASATRVLALSARTVLDASRGRGSQELNNRRLTRWAHATVASAKIDVRVTGREKLDSGPIFVIMSNHQSHYDIPVLYYALGGNIRMVAKKELFDIPLFGRAMTAAGFIEVDRKNRKAAIAALEGAKSLLRNGTHLWIAPEGTRSKSGALLPFKKGGFAVAADAGLPILPVSIWGTRDVLAPDALLTRTHAKVTVTVHDPIATNDVTTPRERENLMTRVRNAIASSLPEHARGEGA